jgi:hypothetical protein
MNDFSNILYSTYTLCPTLWILYVVSTGNGLATGPNKQQV